MRDSTKLRIWKTIYQNLLAGYSEVSPLTENEVAALPNLMIAIELLFVAYWNSVDNHSQRDMANELAQWLFHNKV